MFQNAIHHHMTNEQPMIIFLHYWGPVRPKRWLHI